jgi:hypothetical protein
MAVQIQIRRDTASNWTSVNPILVQGEPGFETDTGKLKIGDGSSVWTSLPYQAAANVADGTIVNADINANAAIAVSKFASGTSRQILQTSVAGNSVEWTSDVSIPGTLSFPLATSALPSIYPGTDTDTGFWSPGANSVAVSTGGTERFRVSDAGGLGVSGANYGDPGQSLVSTGNSAPVWKFVSHEADQIRANGSYSIGTPGSVPFGVGPIAPTGMALAAMGPDQYNVIDIRSGSFC